MTRLAQIKARVEDAASEKKEDNLRVPFAMISLESMAFHDVPFLLSLIDDLTAVVRACEWAGDFCDGPCCIICLHQPWKEAKHSTDCPVGAVLRRVAE